MRCTPFLLAGVLAIGCGNLGKDSKTPGDPLGTYHVTGKLDTSTCGPGALGSSDVWEFDVKLSRDGTDLYWLNGTDVVPGRIAADGVTFAFDAQVTVPVQQSGRGKTGCTIVRRDTASGELGGKGKDVPAFDGRMRFGYTADAASDCSDVLGVTGGLAILPCEMSYTMAATRTEAPK